MEAHPVRAYSGMILLAAAALFSDPARSEEQTEPTETPPPAEDKLLGWTITPGIGVRILDLRIKRTSDGATGTITNDGSFTRPLYASIDVETPTYMVNRGIGVTLRAHATSFTLDNQRVNSSNSQSQSNQDIVSLGTQVTGYYSYITPTVFWRTPDGRGGDMRYGVGYGWWKAWFSGDVILAQDSAATSGMPKTSINDSVSGRGGWLVFVQARWPRGLLEIAFSGMTFSGSGYHYEMQEINMMVGWHFEL